MGPKMYPSALPPAWLVCVVSAAAKTAIGDQYQTRKGGREDERGRKLLCPWAPPPLSPVIIAIAKTTGADKVVARYPSKTQKRQSNKGSGKLVVGVPMGTLCMWFSLGDTSHVQFFTLPPFPHIFLHGSAHPYSVGPSWSQAAASIPSSTCLDPAFFPFIRSSALSPIPYRCYYPSS